MFILSSILGLGIATRPRQGLVVEMPLVVDVCVIEQPSVMTQVLVTAVGKCVLQVDEGSIFGSL